MHGKRLEITAFYVLLLEGFFPSMSSHVLTLCQMPSERTLVYPYWMCVLGHSYILLSSPSKGRKKAAFDNKYAFLNTLLTFTNLFPVSILLLEITSTLRLEESGMPPVCNSITNGSLLTSCTSIWEASSSEQRIQCYWLRNFPLDWNTKANIGKCFFLLASVKPSMYFIRRKCKTHNVP